MLSIIVITRNEEQHIQRTIDSCLKTDAAEIIIVDSNSNDKTQEIVRKNISNSAKKIRLITYDNPPFTAAKGRHIGASQINQKTEYILFLDGDMEIMPDFIPLGIQELSSSPKLAAIMGQMTNYYYENDRATQARIVENIYDLNKHIIGGAMLIKREFYEIAGGYNTSLTVNEESELEYRLNLLGTHTKRIPQKMINHHTEEPRSMVQLKSRLLDRRITALGKNLHLGIRDPRYLRHLIKTNPQIFASLLFIAVIFISLTMQNLILATFATIAHVTYIKITSGRITHSINYLLYAFGMIAGLVIDLIKTPRSSRLSASKKP